jgi:hypothetical protein
VFYRGFQCIEEDIHRQNIRDEVMTEFEEKPKTVLVVHWGDELMINSTSKENSKDHCDRVAVVVSGLKTEKILGFPKALSGTGKAQAKVTYNLLLSVLLSKVDDVVACHLILLHQIQAK